MTTGLCARSNCRYYIYHTQISRFSFSVFFTYVFSSFHDVCVRDIERPFCVVGFRSPLSLKYFTVFPWHTFNRFNPVQLPVCLSRFRRRGPDGRDARKMRAASVLTAFYYARDRIMIKYMWENRPEWEMKPDRLKTPLVMTSVLYTLSSLISLSLSLFFFLLLFLSLTSWDSRAGQTGRDRTYRRERELILHSAGRERYGMCVREICEFAK